MKGFSLYHRSRWFLTGHAFQLSLLQYRINCTCFTQYFIWTLVLFFFRSRWKHVPYEVFYLTELVYLVVNLTSVYGHCRSVQCFCEFKSYTDLYQRFTPLDLLSTAASGHITIFIPGTHSNPHLSHLLVLELSLPGFNCHHFLHYSCRFFFSLLFPLL